MNIHPVILSGGAGSRLWPISREHFPKPLLSISGDKTLLQDTVQRLDALAEVANPLIVCNEEHRYLLLDQLESIGKSTDAILLEPQGRDTAPALTIAALTLTKEDPDAVMVVMPADHVIPDSENFCQRVSSAVELAQQGYLVTFGVTASSPETGYGYISSGSAIPDSEGFFVERFVEKPDLERAMNYVESGNYFWNAGIFVMRADTWLNEISEQRPLIFAACRTACTKSQADGHFVRVDAESFLSSPSESIDYAVMENTKKAAMLAIDTAWSDVGSWSSIWDISERDENGNVSKGDVLMDDCSGSLVYSSGRCVATSGLENIVVVETADAVLVVDKNKSQDVKKIVSSLKEKQREEFRTPSRVHRPWGDYEGIDHGWRYQVKRITVKPGQKLSLQMHMHRAEHWIVVTGTAMVTVGEKKFLLSENESTYIPIGATHRLENPGTIPLEIIEVQSGSYLGEDDIIRFEDVYNRANAAVGES